MKPTGSSSIIVIFLNYLEALAQTRVVPFFFPETLFSFCFRRQEIKAATWPTPPAWLLPHSQYGVKGEGERGPVSQKVGFSLPWGAFPPGGKVRKTLTGWFLPWLWLDTGAQERENPSQAEKLP